MNHISVSESYEGRLDLWNLANKYRKPMVLSMCTHVIRALLILWAHKSSLHEKRLATEKWKLCPWSSALAAGRGVAFSVLDDWDLSCLFLVCVWFFLLLLKSCTEFFEAEVSEVCPAGNFRWFVNKYLDFWQLQYFSSFVVRRLMEFCFFYCNLEAQKQEKLKKKRNTSGCEKEGS